MPPPPGLDAGDGVTLPSRSAIIGGTAAGYHLLDIEGYSHTKDLPTVHQVSPFHCRRGGFLLADPLLRYYPNGDQSDAAEFISVFLEFDQGIAESVEAQVKFSLLDQTGEPVPSHSQMTTTRKFCTDDGHLKDDRFTIRCDVFVPKELRTEHRPVDLVAVPPYDLHLHLERLLAAKTGADVTFEVGGETLRAHRCILAARSTVFEAELSGQMKESADATVIRVDDMDAGVFRALLCFIYTDGLPDCPPMEKAAMSQHLLVAADRYNLERLKLICEDNMCAHIGMGSVASILVLAEQHHCHGLKEACFQFLSSPLTLNAVMATDDFEHLTRNCPAVFKELMSNIAARVPLGY
ncbi:LOW QUALITY PROTEIN: hypothetical protein SETIT_9G264500v2 [Setaria italica]|uniref:BTB domain-containing protein n=1 Tax=Setaria italica TaxID=4555 RepID=A0A368SMM6_SETIT|nr:LOW QUALITY PROTEIN: hypothetical protein SETIT_9G264500v2 [Setaria italica]